MMQTDAMTLIFVYVLGPKSDISTPMCTICVDRCEKSLRFSLLCHWRRHLIYNNIIIIINIRVE